ncbi:MAG: DinB family protein, partial [Acidobacteria bacterium]|nr:DinB family protein [Acidobacteriota bacterium]
MAGQKMEEIALQMKATRAATLALFDLAREEDLHVSPGFGFRPIIWHLAHIGVFEGYWLLRKLKNEEALDERYERIFDPINTPREQSKNLPTRREMEDYLTRVRERTLRHLDEVQFDKADPLLRDGYLFRLVLEHEQQHQETLAYIFHLLSPSKKTRPASLETLDHLKPLAFTTELTPPREMVMVAEGTFVMGAGEDGFAYDNERPAHTVHVPAFKIDKLLTTNEEYAHFINEGGY